MANPYFCSKEKAIRYVVYSSINIGLWYLSYKYYKHNCGSPHCDRFLGSFDPATRRTRVVINRCHQSKVRIYEWILPHVSENGIRVSWSWTSSWSTLRARSPRRWSGFRPVTTVGRRMPWTCPTFDETGNLSVHTGFGHRITTGSTSMSAPAWCPWIQLLASIRNPSWLVTHITTIYDKYIELVDWVSKPTYNWWSSTLCHVGHMRV